MAPHARSQIHRFVIDESVSTANWLRFQEYARENAIPIGDTYSIRKCHPGIPDRLILQRLLDRTTALVTADRPLHNQALELGLQSFHIGPDRIRCVKLEGIHPRPLIPPAKRQVELKADYRPPSPALRAALMPSSRQRLKKLAVKRRRIRNHFGGLEQLAQNAITVSWVPHGATTLIGVRLRVSSHADIQALDACESYIAEIVEPEAQDHAAFCHALIVPLQLLLHPVPTVVYHDSTTMRDWPIQPSGILGELITELVACFPHLQFMPVTKSWHLERMIRKLEDLRTRGGNEIVSGSLQDLLHAQAWRQPGEAARPGWVGDRAASACGEEA